MEKLINDRIAELQKKQSEEKGADNTPSNK